MENGNVVKNATMLREERGKRENDSYLGKIKRERGPSTVGHIYTLMYAMGLDMNPKEFTDEFNRHIGGENNFAYVTSFTDIIAGYKEFGIFRLLCSLLKENILTERQVRWLYKIAMGRAAFMGICRG